MYDNCSEDAVMLNGQSRKKMDFVQVWIVFIARDRERRSFLIPTRIMALSALTIYSLKLWIQKVSLRAVYRIEKREGILELPNSLSA